LSHGGRWPFRTVFQPKIGCKNRSSRPDPQSSSQRVGRLSQIVVWYSKPDCQRGALPSTLRDVSQGSLVAWRRCASLQLQRYARLECRRPHPDRQNPLMLGRHTSLTIALAVGRLRRSTRAGAGFSWTSPAPSESGCACGALVCNLDPYSN
jgi:hypothetical protein